MKTTILAVFCAIFISAFSVNAFAKVSSNNSANTTVGNVTGNGNTITNDSTVTITGKSNFANTIVGNVGGNENTISNNFSTVTITGKSNSANTTVGNVTGKGNTINNGSTVTIN
jgi:hypothetical protein